MRHSWLKSFLAVLLVFPAAAQTQKKPQEEVTIRARASEVLVDVVVTDKRNKLVGDLKPEDFKVYEDGVEQKVLSARLARTVTETTGAEASGSAPRPAEPTPAPVVEVPPAQIQNMTILLLDYSTTQFQNQKLVQEASVKYVEERLRPNDLMAVFVLGNRLHFITDFTSDKATLIAALKSREVIGSALAAERANVSAEIAIARDTRPPAPTPAGLTGPTAASMGTSMAATGPGRAAAMMAARIEAQFVALQSAMNKRLTRGVLTAIRAISLGVEQIPGRKSLILFSQGFVVGEALEEEMHSVVALANRARLAVYAIDSRGLETRELSSSLVPTDELTAEAGKSQRDKMMAVGGETVFDRALQAGRDQEESALRYVSISTGGFLIRNTNDLGVGLNRVAEEMHGYYLLAYQPSNTAYDGKFRQIKVTVRQPGLIVNARPGYYAIPEGYEILSPEEYQSVQAARGRGAGTPLFMRAAAFRAEESRYRVPVVLEMPTRTVQFEQSGKLRTAKIEVIGLVLDEARKTVARFGGRINYSAGEAEYKALEPGNLSLLNSVDLPPGNFTLAVAVRDLASGASLYHEQGLYLREPPAGLALSTILLARDVDKVGASGTAFLSVGGASILPSAQCQFRNGDNLIFYFDAYNPRTQSDRADLTVSLYLMHNGRRLGMRLPEYRLDRVDAAPVPHVTVARYVQLAGLEPGSYSLVVQARDTLANRTELAHAAFTVVK